MERARPSFARGELYCISSVRYGIPQHPEIVYKKQGRFSDRGAVEVYDWESCEYYRRGGSLAAQVVGIA